MIKTVRTKEFEQWFIIQTYKTQALIEARIFRIEEYGYFGDSKYLYNGLLELRWKNGLRIYFSKVGDNIILLINGGNKNEQKKDIKRAEVLLEKYTS